MESKNRKEIKKKMKKLILNDGRSVEVQEITTASDVMHIRLILQTSEQLKALFSDNFATKKMTETENGRETAMHENYTNLVYIKEETGGIWEVEIVRQGADLNTRLAMVEQQTQNNVEALQMAIVELTTIIASIKQQEGDIKNV